MPGADPRHAHARLAARPGTARRSWPLVLALAALLLGGCATRVVYNQLDWVTVWYLERYVDLDRPQEDMLRQVVLEVIAWHRATQLPEYAAIARELRAEAAGTITPAMLTARYEQIDGLFDQFRTYIVPGSARVFRTLTAPQIREIAENLEDENDELAEEYSGDTPDDRRRQQEKVINKNLKRMIGGLTPAQEAAVHAGVSRLHDAAPQWLQRRRAWQAAFLALLQNDRRSPDFESRLLQLVLDPNRFDEPGYREQVNENRQVIIGLVAEVLATLTPAQRTHLEDRLDEFAEDFTILSQQGAQAAKAARPATGAD